MNAEEQTLYNDFVKDYRTRNTITNIIVIFGVVICSIFTIVTKNLFVLLVMLLIALILIIFVPKYMRMIYAVTLIKKIYAKAENQCDSKTYYHVCKALCEKYPKNAVLVEHYIYSLQIDENDYSELKGALKRFNSYQKEVFYILAYMKVLSEEEQKNFFEQHYEKIKDFYDRRYLKTKEIIYPVLIEILRYKLNEEYEEELKLYALIKDEESKLSRAMYTYNEAICLNHLGNQKECEELLVYVVREGNTLRVKYLAEEYLKEMHPEMLEQNDKTI